MILRRTCAMAIAVLALAGCATSGYGGSYDQYPGNQYPDEAYNDGPYYGGAGYDADYDGDSDRYFHPARNVTCDRSRDVCYDRYGLSYHATARYLGEREANQAYKHYGDKVFLFSPKRGVICDRRTQRCSGGNWPNNIYGDNMQSQDQSPGGRPAVGLTKEGYARQQQQRQGWDDDDGQPSGLPRLLNPNGKDGNGSCPPMGCK